MTRARIAVLTTGRADYGHLVWIARAVQDDPDLELLLYATGSHLATSFGDTVREIEDDGLPVHRRIEILLAADTASAAAKAAALALSGFGDAIADDRPDVLVLLGDRFEIVPVALACVLHSVPVAHVHGGETTEGAQDEYFRHAVTKLATLHFPATEAYRRRILQMGERPDRTHAFGAPGLDHLHRTPLLGREEVQQVLGLALDRPTALVTYHPVTTEPGEAGSQIDGLLAALLAEAPRQAVFTAPNADPEGRIVHERIRRFCRSHPERFRLVENLGTERYLSSLRHLDLLIGNSSSGLVEAPSFAIPVVNVGTRQRGRVTAPNVLCVGYGEAAIREGIRRALSAEFREGLRDMTNPYDRFADGRVSARIVEALKTFVRDSSPRTKAFVDLECEGV